MTHTSLRVSPSDTAPRPTQSRRGAADRFAGGRRKPTTPLVDRFLPVAEAEAVVVRETVVDAPPDLTYSVISTTNLIDPVVRALFAARELPARVLARLRGRTVAPTARSATVCDLLRPGAGMTVLAWRPRTELVIGSIGRFWERDYGHRHVAARDFTDFREPGYAKLAMAFEVRPLADGRSLLRYEARTATTDDDARRRFRRYWRLIAPGVGLVMRRAVALIRQEAERRASGRITAPESPLSACSG